MGFLFLEDVEKANERLDIKISKVRPRLPIKGVVKAKECSSCGHHEVGIITEAGGFIALKPGMKIAVLRMKRKNDKRVGAPAAVLNACPP